MNDSQTNSTLQQHSAGPTPDAWLIWSNEHNTWWNPNSAGYTNISAKAGRYSFAAAHEICTRANYRAGSGNAGTGVPPEVMVPSPEIEPLVSAAGDLLSACKEWVDYFDMLTREDEPGCRLADARREIHGPRVERSRAAIRKATGGAV